MISFLMCLKKTLDIQITEITPVKLTQLMRRRIHHWQGQDVQQSRWKRKVSSKVLDEICRHRSGRAAMGLLKEWQEKYLHLLDWHIFDKLLNVLEDDCRHSNNRNYIRGPSKHSNKRFVTLDEVGFTDVMSRISTGGGASLD
ncbi:hypothetical protein M5689_021965 [Euphorbia peplus]|nr:hypothetical protein M5689_021965 [Euphorbia peplus]